MSQSQYSAAQPPPDGYAQPQQGAEYVDYEATSPPGVGPGPPAGPGPAQGRKKRRYYAGQAYEFGAGGNAAATPAGAQGGQPLTGFNQQQDAAGYPQGGYAQNPAAVQPGQTPMYGGQDQNVGGYQPPGATYPTQQPQAAAAPVQGMTQQFGQMDMNQRHQPQQQPQAAQQNQAPRLNQLYPTDLQNQPLNVAELDYPPPPAILPPNVSLSPTSLVRTLICSRRA